MELLLALLFQDGNESLDARAVVVRRRNKMHRYKEIIRGMSLNIFSPWLMLIYSRDMYYILFLKHQDENIPS